jgi:hypothetical protein
MKREKRLTKRERKALAPSRPGAAPGARAAEPQHIHCVACGRHIEPEELRAAGTAKLLRCQHGSTFAACIECEAQAVARLAEHDRTGRPVEAASAWH